MSLSANFPGHRVWVVRATCCAFCFALGPPAFAKDYASDPCKPPGLLGDGYQSDFDRMLKRASVLDAKASDFNARCDVGLERGSAAEVACARDEERLGDEIAQHDDAVSAFNARLVTNLQSKLDDLQRTANKTRTELQRATQSAPFLQVEIDGWIELGEKARRDAQVQALFSSFDIVLAGADIKFTSDKARASALIERMKADVKRIQPLQRRVKIERIISTLKTWQDIVKLFAIIKDDLKLAYDVQKPMQEDRYLESLGQFTAGTLSHALTLMNASPGATLTVTAFEISVASSYGWLARVIAENRVNQYLAVGESNLRAIGSLGALYTKQVDEITPYKAALGALKSGKCPAR